MKPVEFLETVIKFSEKAEGPFLVRTSQSLTLRIGGQDVIAMMLLLELYRGVLVGFKVGEVGEVLDKLNFWFTFLVRVVAKDDEVEGLEWYIMEGEEP